MTCQADRWLKFCEIIQLADQRFVAALRAISLRRLADSFSARAFPPFWPPRRPRATAAGFFPSSVTVSGGASPVAISTISLAS
jgi:hypothetical protein